MIDITEHIFPIEDIFNAHYPEMEERFGKPKALSIDFLPTIDNLIWGIPKKSLVVVAGRTSNAKSVFMLQLAESFAKQKKVVYFFTFEMTPEKCLERLFSMNCSIPSTQLVTGDFVKYKAMYESSIQDYQKQLKDRHLYLISGIGKRIREVLELLEKLPKPDAVFIDYINMVKGVNKSQKEVIDEYIKDIRNLAIKKDFACILAAQINRDVHKNQKNTVPVPSLWHLKDTGSLEEHADLVFILHWEYHYTQEDGVLNKFVVKVAKNRNGRTGEFDCAFEPQFSRIKEVDNVL